MSTMMLTFAGAQWRNVRNGQDWRMYLPFLTPTVLSCRVFVSSVCRVSVAG